MDKKSIKMPFDNVTVVTLLWYHCLSGGLKMVNELIQFMWIKNQLYDF
jgi:hypothetical protein